MVTKPTVDFEQDEDNDHCVQAMYLFSQFFLQVSKWGDKVAGLIVVEPGISTASFKEWGEGKVSGASGDIHKQMSGK